jgi:hypothetical protein
MRGQSLAITGSAAVTASQAAIPNSSDGGMDIDVRRFQDAGHVVSPAEKGYVFSNSLVIGPDVEVAPAVDHL